MRLAEIHYLLNTLLAYRRPPVSLKKLKWTLYANTEFSMTMIDPRGLSNGFQYIYDLGLPQMAKLPTYLKKTGYKNPDEYDHAPFHYIMQPDEGSDNAWHWLAAHPCANTSFNHFMIREVQLDHSICLSTDLNEYRASFFHARDRPPWASGPLLERLLNGYDPARPLIVDIGGGNGTAQVKIINQLLCSHHDVHIIVQDLPSVIVDARNSSLPPQIRLLSHDFFDPQPEEAKAARAYYLSHVLHDWPDKQVAQILANVKAAMKVGYSRLYIQDPVVAERDTHNMPLIACLDISMMSHFAAMERTMKQWQELLSKAGLKFVDYHEQYPGSGVIEADLV